MKNQMRDPARLREKIVREMMMSALPGLRGAPRTSPRLLPAAKEDHLLFLQFASLTKQERKMAETRGRSPIPFHHLMTRLSPVYKAIFASGARSKIKLRPSRVSRKKALVLFDPFADSVLYPNTKKKLERLAGQEYSNRVFREWNRVTDHGFSSYHDMMHLILARVIPYRKEESLKDYLFLIEAIVNVIEIQMSAELGPQICRVLWRVGAFYRSYSPGSIREWQTDWRKAFVGNLLFYLGDLHGVRGARMRRLFPLWKRYLHNERYFREAFTSETIPLWFKKAHDIQDRPLPTSWKAKTKRLKSLPFSLRELQDETETLFVLADELAGLFSLGSLEPT